MGILGKLLIVLLLFLFTTGTVWAQSTDSAKPRNPFERLKDTFQLKKEAVQEKRASTSAKRQEVREKIQTRRDEAKENRLAKLDAAKLRICEGKEGVLTNRLSTLTRLTENMLSKFDQIVIRVTDFYTEKILPAGGSVANYDSLLADIETKKAAVEDSLSLASANTEDFSCDGDDPKGVLASFREDMQAVKQALADYRTAIKDLIVAVKSSASVLRDEKAETENE